MAAAAAVVVMVVVMATAAAAAAVLVMAIVIMNTRDDRLEDNEEGETEGQKGERSEEENGAPFKQLVDGGCLQCGH